MERNGREDITEALRARFVKVESDECLAVFKAYAQHHHPVGKPR